MVTGLPTQWGFTLAFLALAVHSGWLLVSSHRAPGPLVGAVLHLLMSVDMAAMNWGWWDRVPVLPQLVAFGAGVLWYAGVALRPPWWGGAAGHRRWSSAAGRWSAAGHAAMMAAMVWMVAAMAARPADAAGHHHAELGTPMAVLGVGLTAALLVAGASIVVALLEVRRHSAPAGRPVRLGAEALMALAMGLACWLMLTG